MSIFSFHFFSSLTCLSGLVALLGSVVLGRPLLKTNNTSRFHKIQYTMSIRLIEVKTMRLRSFNSQKAPRYVILSHTWVENEEVSYQEMCQIAEGISHPAKRKSGYRKIWETCRQSMTHGYEYAWVDTCCIDKTSSAELSEAINSMFRWYRDAAVCIAYLNDYTFVDSNYMTDMRYCSWFTRGWCLQELIAPKYLVFYDKTWKEFGSKAGLVQLIASITGIDEEVLEDHTAMNSLPVARRMSWASSRITTRVEDIAYCLLGIFDIHMPMLYGEGEKAFVRLQEEIVRRLNDTSIFLFYPSVTREQTSMSFDSTGKFSDNIPHKNVPESSTTSYITDIMDLQFCGMFAASPADFRACGDIVYRPGSRAPFGRQAFSASNRGIQIGRQVLNCIQRKHCFMWETAFCHSKINRDFGKPVLDGVIFLRKIGSNLFARVLLDHPTKEYVTDPVLYDDACILLHITPSTSQQIHNTLKAALRIQLNARYGTATSLSEPTPRDNWDESGNLFVIPDFTSDDRPFEGSVRISTVKKRNQVFGRTYQDFFPDIFLHFRIYKLGRAFVLLSMDARLEEYMHRWPVSQNALQSHSYRTADGLLVTVQICHEAVIDSSLFTYQVNISEDQYLITSQ